MTPLHLPATFVMGLLAVIAVAVIVAVMVRTRKRAPEPEHVTSPTTTDQPDIADDDGRTGLEQQILAFALELRRSDSKDTIQRTIGQTLPAILGVDRIWIVARFGERRQVISYGDGDTSNVNPLIAGDGEWATFPLKVADRPIGILGVEIRQRPLSAHTRRAIGTIAPLIAESLHAVDLISELRELSSVDQLTGCATRQSGVQRLRAELTRAHRASRAVAILILDLDNFKGINDRFGHNCGDAVLSAVGRTLTQTLRVSDIRCRWGGEEFLIVLPETGLEQAKRVAVTITRRIAETATYCDSSRIQVTASVGVTMSSPDDEDSDALIARADTALYRAKADGRNCVRVLLAESNAAAAPAAAPPTPVAVRDRRDPQRANRREHPGFGRRKTDATDASAPPH